MNKSPETAASLSSQSDTGGWLQRFVRGTYIGRFLLLPWRFAQMSRVTGRAWWQGLFWTFTSKEHYNYTYDLAPRNLKHLAAFISVLTGAKFETVQGYIDELMNDQELKAHVARLTAASSERHVADTTVRYGRRAGWYALVRAYRPKCIVETGVDKGLGSVVLAAALLRNEAEGHPGELIAIDINPRAGYLVQGKYLKPVRLLFEDSLAALRKLEKPVDFFIHDSNHDPDFEAAEYSAVESKLAAESLVISDNAEHTDELIKFAARTRRQFLFFSEKPVKHWWPGEGIGVAFAQVSAFSPSGESQHRVKR